MNSKLKQAAKTKDEFLATMSHELRTPLNAVLALSEVLLEETSGTLNDGQKKYIKNIYDSGKHLLDLINDLLDISKIQAGKMELKLSRDSLDEIISASIVLVKQQANNKNQEIRYKSSNKDIQLVSDSRKLKQVVVNLLSNAVKFTPDKGSLGVSTKMIDPDWLEIQVWDTGIGISRKDQSLLFKPFVQVDSSLARSAEGTGLGLFLVKSMIELHNGKITLNSIEGKGTTFTITLPTRINTFDEIIVGEEEHENEDHLVASKNNENDANEFYIGS